MQTSVPKFSPSQYLLPAARALLLLQIFLITWLCSGTRVEFLIPIFLTAILLYVSATFTDLSASEIIFEKLLFLIVIFFIIFALIQYVNPFAETVVGEKFRYIRNLNHIKFLPSSIKAEFHSGNPMRSLCVLLSGFLTVMGAIPLLKNRHFPRISLSVFALNSTAMGVFAIFQKLSKFASPYNALHSTSDYYGTFFLSNAAGAFLNMGMSASIALSAIYAKERGFHYKVLSFLYMLCAAINGISACYSDSKGAQIICAGIILFSILYIIFTFTQRIANRKTSLLAITTFLSIFIAVMLSAIHIYAVISRLTDKMESSVEGRIAYYWASFKIIKKAPIFGIGGECSRYLLPSEISRMGQSPNSPFYMPERPHSDILEYTIDYGILGLIALATCGLAWVYCFCKNRKYDVFPNAMLAIGAISCIFHGSFDMELHIPSTMIAFGLMCTWALANLGKIGNES